MDTLEDRTRQNLSAEDQEFQSAIDAKDSACADISAAFHSRMRSLNALCSLFGFAFFAMALLCTWRFVVESDVRFMPYWGAGTFLSFAGLGLTKFWFSLELRANAMAREIKRIEVQLSSLAAASRNPERTR